MVIEEVGTLLFFNEKYVNFLTKARNMTKTPHMKHILYSDQNMIQSTCEKVNCTSQYAQSPLKIHKAGTSCQDYGPKQYDEKKLYE